MNRMSRKKIHKEEFIITCRANGLRLTPQRIAIYEEVKRSSTHPTAESIYRKIKKKYPNISFDTVNRTLLTFSDIGLLRVVEGYGEARRFDSNTKIHHHFICLKCGDIIDFNHKKYDQLNIPEEFKSNYQVTNKRVILEGICKKCISTG